MTTRIAALLTCHNRRDLTLAALAALVEQSRPDVDVTVYLVDDGSTDGTREAVEAQFPETVVLRGDGDLFWAPGMRRAMAAARPADPDHYLWLNDDVVLDDDALERLLTTSATLQAGGTSAVVVGATRDPDTGEVTYGGRYRPSRWHRSRFEVQQPTSTASPAETMNGNIVLVPRSVADSIGSLGPYRHSFADQDYGLRARAAGHEVWVAPGTVGTCRRNPSPTYGGRFGRAPLLTEVRTLFGIKGLLPSDWARYSRRWHGPAWPLFFVSPYVRGLVGIARAHLRSASDRGGRGRRPDRVRAGRAPLFLVWRAYQGRVDAMRDHFGYEVRYLSWRPAPRWLRPLEYVVKLAQSAVLLAKHRPDELWLQLPPTPKLYLAAAYKLLRPSTRVVADCHNIMLERPWIDTPGRRWLLGSVADVVLVHNHVVLERALALGFPADRTMLLPTAPAVDDVDDARGASDRVPFTRPWALFPASFKADEPVEALLDAVRDLDDLTLVITGDVRTARHRVRQAPPNVELVGWVDRERYKLLVAEADVVVGLTTLPDVQLSVAKEAVGFGRAMVLSDTPLMRELFPAGAVYASNDAAGLRTALRQAIIERDRLAEESRNLAGELAATWKRHADAVLDRLRTRSRSASGRARHAVTTTTKEEA